MSPTLSTPTRGRVVLAASTFGLAVTLAACGDSASSGESSLTRLSANSAAADRAFLTLMQEHHQGAIDMAKTELAQGSNADAETLARSISMSQAAGIAEMQTMIAGLG